MARKAVVNVFSGNNRLPCLDGWRAIAIVMVIGAHCKMVNGFPAEWEMCFHWCFDGNLGVRFFFVISGFLITLLMLRQKSQGRFSLRHFWIRRALRILPVYVAFLLALYLLQEFTHFSMPTVEWLGASTFTLNYVGGQWLPGHLWSLSVEEQFYLVWPLILAFLLIRKQPLISLGLLVIFAACVFRTLGYLRKDWPAFGTFSLLTNMDSLAVGCGFAFFAFFEEEHFRKMMANRTTVSLFIGTAVAMIYVPYIFGRLLMFGLFTVPLAPLLQAVGFGILMLASICYSKHWTVRWLEWKPVVWIGVLSYSIYIWQQIFCTSPAVFGSKNHWYLCFPGWMIASLLVACLSYYLIEKPFLSLKRIFA